jgi:hypothetical protein
MVMKRLVAVAVVAVLGTPGFTFSQPGDVTKVLADARAALGGEKKLVAVKTVAANGQSTRVSGQTSSPPSDVEMAFDLPDKFMKKDVAGTNNDLVIMRTTGFNGDQLIDVLDQPPTSGGTTFVFRAGGTPPGTALTPEQEAAQGKARLLSAKQEFARLALGILASSPAAYPLQFSYAGQAESSDGKADIVQVKGEGDFDVRLFIDTKTHLPLMISWMAKEPLTITRFGGQAAGNGTPEQMKQQMMERAAAAEADRRTVEYRIYYADYRDIDGIKFPFRLQRSIDGKPSEQVTFEKVKINGKIDPKKFETK